MKRGHAPRILEYVEHILEAIDRATGYVAGMDFDEFERDTRTQDAVLRAIQVVGEAANQIRAADAQFAASHPNVPWDLMYGMRNRIAHGYFEIDLEVVWRTVENDLPALRRQINSVL